MPVLQNLDTFSKEKADKSVADGEEIDVFLKIVFEMLFCVRFIPILVPTLPRNLVRSCILSMLVRLHPYNTNYTQ